MNDFEVDWRPEAVVERAGARIATRSPEAVFDRRLVIDPYRVDEARGPEPRFDPDDAAPWDAETEIDWRDEDELGGAAEVGFVDHAYLSPVRTEMRLWANPATQLVVEVPPPVERHLADSGLRGNAVARWARLGRFGAHLALLLEGENPKPHTAASIAELHRRLPPLASVDFARALKIDKGDFSREASLIVVSLPVGRVALDFFFSKSPRGKAPEGLPAAEIAEALLYRDDLFSLTVPELRQRIPNAGTTLGKLVPWSRAARQWPHLVASAAARWQDDPRLADEQVKALGRRLILAREASSPSTHDAVGALDLNRADPVLWRAMVMAVQESA